jgi:hypothetical protein
MNAGINDQIASQVVTKSAFFQARKQLSYKAFIELNRQITNIINGLILTYWH